MRIGVEFGYGEFRFYCVCVSRDARHGLSGYKNAGFLPRGISVVKITTAELFWKWWWGAILAPVSVHAGVETRKL